MQQDKTFPCLMDVHGIQGKIQIVLLITCPLVGIRCNPKVCVHLGPGWSRSRHSFKNLFDASIKSNC